MTTSTINNTLRDLIFENINDKYAWGNYGEFKVLMMRENGFINVTKLCKDGGKAFIHWRETKTSKRFVNEVSSSIGILRDDILITITGGNQPLTRGTYAHPDLVPHIASWVSPSFAIKVSRIVNEYLVREEKERISRLEIQKNVLEGEKSDLIKKADLLLKRLDIAAEERRIYELKAEEERRKAVEERRISELKAEERYQEMCKRYGFQEDKLDSANKTLVGVKQELVGNKQEMGEVKHELMETKDKLEDVQESLELNTERLGHVEDKLGIAKEIVVPKEQNKDYHEMFTLLKRTDYDPTDEDDYEYYAICGQIKYVKTSRNRRMKTEGMVEVLSFEYTPNTKNILHRIKEQLRGFITCSGNKIDRNVRFSERRFVSRIREIEKERVDLLN
jgi:hypothetical protein